MFPSVIHLVYIDFLNPFLFQREKKSTILYLEMVLVISHYVKLKHHIIYYSWKSVPYVKGVVYCKVCCTE